MLIFIDDSGDAGFKLDKGSTSHFVIAMVIFDDELEAEKTAVAIKELKRSLRFSEQMEFRFFKNRRDIRLKFLDTIKDFNFRVRCLVVDKALIHSEELKNNKNSFYAYFIKEALKHNGATILNAKIRIDGSGDRLFRKNFFTYLRRELNSEDKRVVNNCRMVDSGSNVLVQMADIIAGSINRSYNTEKKDHEEYIKVIKKRIQDKWDFK